MPPRGGALAAPPPHQALHLFLELRSFCNRAAGLPIDLCGKRLQALVFESHRTAVALQMFDKCCVRFGALFGIGQTVKYSGVPALSFKSFGCEPSLQLA